MTDQGCRFKLSNIKEGEVEEEYGYNIFEPTVTLLIDGRNVFQALGIEGVDIVIVMDFRKVAIMQTLEMLDYIKNTQEGEYEYWLMGTAFGIQLSRSGESLKISLKVNGKMGPVPGNMKWPQTVEVGSCSVRQWVEAVVLLTKELSDMFRRLNPRTYADPTFQKEEAKLAQLQSWLESRAS